MPKSERLPGLHSGAKTTVVPGDPIDREVGFYGKKPPPFFRGQNSPIKTHPAVGGLTYKKTVTYGSGL